MKRFDAVTAPAFSNRPNVSSAVRDSQLQKSHVAVGTSSPRRSAASRSSRSSRPMPPKPKGFRLRAVFHTVCWPVTRHVTRTMACPPAAAAAGYASRSPGGALEE